MLEFDRKLKSVRVADGFVELGDLGNIGLALGIAKVPAFFTSICIISHAVLYVYNFSLMAFHKMVTPLEGYDQFCRS